MQYFNVQANDGSIIKMTKYIMGTGSLDKKNDEDHVFELFDRYRELGGNTFDTARAYGGFADQLSFGLCEAYVGEYIRSRQCRRDVVVITKGGFPALNPDFTMKRFRLTREAILGDFYTSYDNLQIGAIDLYLLHRDDPSLPVPAIMDTLFEIADTGDVKALGVSNWSIERILEANAYAASQNRPGFVISEIQWGYAYLDNEMRQDDTVSIMNKSLYKKYLEAGIPVMAFTPQDGGLWSKLYSGEETWDTLAPSRKLFDCPVNRRKYKKIEEYCNRNNVSPAALVTAYLASHKAVCAPILGCRSIRQLEDSMAGADLNLEEKVIEWMDEV